MTVILARLADSSGIAQSVVHAVLLAPEADPSPTVLHAACGETLPADQVERVERFTGNPCATCMLLAFGHDSSTEVPDAAPEPDFDETDKAGHYAVALRGTRVRHLVAEDAAQGWLDGRPVVQTLCARLGWGPLATGPTHWPMCDECEQLAEVPT